MTDPIPLRNRPVPPAREGRHSVRGIKGSPSPNTARRSYKQSLPSPNRGNIRGNIRGNTRGIPPGVPPRRGLQNPRALARCASAIELTTSRGKPVRPARTNQVIRSNDSVPPTETPNKSGSLIKIPFKKSVSKVHQKPVIDSSSFQPKVKKERKRKTLNKETKNFLPNLSSPDLNQTQGPTRAYGKRSEFYKDDKINHRLSKNLAAPAVSLHFRLTDRPEYETLRSSMIIKEAVTPQPYATATWTSKVRINEEWLPLDENDQQGTPLISRECLASGYHIEVARKEIMLSEDCELLDADKDVKFFEQLSLAGNITHFVGVNSKGMIIISMENEKNKKFQRTIIRTPQEDQRLLISAQSSSSNKYLKALMNQCPTVSNIKFTKIKKEETDIWTKELLKIESQMVERTYKFGVLYAASGQTTEDQFFNNVDGSDDFNIFLSSIASKIQLNGWKHFRGGLDVKSGTTGEFSFYSIHKGCEIMFHVSTLIPFYPKDEQQVERKRHLGNDIVVIIFKEGKEPFDPLCIRSQFNHAFVVVQPVHIEEGHTHYAVEWCCKPGVPPFKPYETSPSIYESGEEFKERFLTKLLNAQRASMSAKDFQHKMARTRKMLFEEIAKQYPYKK